MGTILESFKALGKIPWSIDLLNKRFSICMSTGPPSNTRLGVLPYISPDLLIPKSLIILWISSGPISVRNNECTIGFFKKC